MKIMMIIPTLGYGGAESLVLSWLAQWLDSPEVREIVLVLYSDRFLERLGNLHNNPKFRLEIEASNTPWRMFRPRYFIHLWRLRKIILRHSPDIIHSNLVAQIDLALLYRLLPSDIRFVHTVHCPAKHDSIGLYRRLLRGFYGARRVNPVAISSGVRDSITDRYRRDSILIYNGAAVPPKTERFPEVKAEVERIAKSGDGVPKRVFMAVGRVMYPKNYELMTDVFRRMHRDGKPAVLIVLGNLMNDETRRRYLPMTSEGIFFLDKKDNVGDYLRCCDFFCMTSVYEGLSMAITEAMSLGIPPIITPTPGMMESLGPSFDDLISHDYSVESYYDTVMKALEMPEEERAAISGRLIERYEKNFTLKVCSESYLRLFEKLCGADRHSPATRSAER